MRDEFIYETRMEKAEKLNGRLAMIGVTIAIITQLVAGSIW
tara:strand:- start:198 stop:320 length:123 start_codon:yes stop_codon:yes gene_type:complete